jgi:hypothetical protein
VNADRGMSIERMVELGRFPGPASTASTAGSRVRTLDMELRDAIQKIAVDWPRLWAATNYQGTSPARLGGSAASCARTTCCACAGGSSWSPPIRATAANPVAITFSKAVVEEVTPSRRATIGVYVTDRGDQLLIRSAYVEALYPTEAVHNMLADLIEVALTIDVALTIAQRPGTRVSEFHRIANRYSGRMPQPGTEMKEFVVGSDRLPSGRRIAQLRSGHPDAAAPTLGSGRR